MRSHEKLSVVNLILRAQPGLSQSDLKTCRHNRVPGVKVADLLRVSLSSSRSERRKEASTRLSTSSRLISTKTIGWPSFCTSSFACRWFWRRIFII